MDYVKEIIQSSPEMDEIFHMIMERNRYQWRRFIGPTEIFKWLNNFSGKDEIYLALVLANKISYYTLEEIRHLWKTILMKRVRLFLLSEIFKNKPLPNTQEWFPAYLRKKCIFLGYGKAGKSGPSALYIFKQSHGISNLNYMEFFEFLHSPGDLSTRDWIFLLDDFIGSGNQARKTWYVKRKSQMGEMIKKRSLNDIHKENPHLGFIYLAAVGCRKGKKVIEEKTPVKVILGDELDERFKCFSDDSIIYQDPEERKRARRVMKEKGRKLYRYPLGYGSMELAVAFYHNTPNNSLPVIWKRKDGIWYPLFERF